MPSVGQIEKKTQERVLALLSQRLGYTYLGDWIDRPANSNIEPERLKGWIRENRPGARVLIITDRTELDEQIEKVFLGVSENIYRTKSGADLIATLGKAEESLICTLVHKFGGKDDDDGAEGKAATKGSRR